MLTLLMCRCGASGGFARLGHGVEGDAGSAGEGGDRAAAVADQMVAGRYDFGKRGAHGSPVDLRQDGVEGRALPVAGDEDGNIVLIGPRMLGLAAPFMRGARQVGPPAFEGFEDQVSSASTTPLKFAACWRQARAETDAASGRRSSDERRTVARSWPGSCLDYRGREPAISPSCADAPSASWSAR